MKLVLYSPDEAEVSQLRTLFLGQAEIAVFHGTGPAATAKYHLDAIFLPGMHATYWGVEPMNKNDAKVYPSPPGKRALGLPPLFVAGWLLPETIADDPSSFGVRYAKLLLRAVDRYNASASGHPVASVGSIPAFLGLNTEYAGRTADFLKETIAERARQRRHFEVPVKLSA